jgi:hypothetical protein
MSRLLMLICFVIGLEACHDKNEIPRGILKKEQMQDVLWDIMQADAFTNSFIKKDSSKNPTNENIKLQKQIFLIHGISREDFYTSYSYYKEHPGLMLAVIDSITAKEIRDDGIRAKRAINHPAILDSIKMRTIRNQNILLKEKINHSPIIVSSKPKVVKKKKMKHTKTKAATIAH